MPLRPWGAASCPWPSYPWGAAPCHWPPCPWGATPCPWPPCPWGAAKGWGGVLILGRLYSFSIRLFCIPDNEINGV